MEGKIKKESYWHWYIKKLTSKEMIFTFLAGFILVGGLFFAIFIGMNHLSWVWWFLIVFIFLVGFFFWTLAEEIIIIDIRQKRLKGQKLKI